MASVPCFPVSQTHSRAHTQTHARTKRARTRAADGCGDDKPPQTINIAFEDSGPGLVKGPVPVQTCLPLWQRASRVALASLASRPACGAAPCHSTLRPARVFWSVARADACVFRTHIDSSTPWGVNSAPLAWGPVTSMCAWRTGGGAMAAAHCSSRAVCVCVRACVRVCLFFFLRLALTS